MRTTRMITNQNNRAAPSRTCRGFSGLSVPVWLVVGVVVLMVWVSCWFDALCDGE